MEGREGGWKEGGREGGREGGKEGGGREGGREGKYTSSPILFLRWTTRIVLPLKPDLVASNMARKFNDVQPSLLLFLHRLRSITVEDKVYAYNTISKF